VTPGPHRLPLISNSTPHGSGYLDLEVLLLTGTTLAQITDTSGLTIVGRPSLAAGKMAFSSTGDPTGANPDGGYDVFHYDGSNLAQITDTTGATSTSASLEGHSIAFASDADLTGANSDGNSKIYVARPTVFADGLEAGDTSAWSATLP
jgi:Tol biopolymer transport system component